MGEATIVRVRRNGVITIPDTVREALHINDGDLVRLHVEKIETENITGNQK